MHEINTDSSHNAYWLDEDEKIIKVHAKWDAFAQENDGALALAKKVLGKPIWTFVVEDNTRLWLRALLNLAKLCDKVVERAYRCDSPTLKRYMTMIIEPLGEGKLKVIHRLERTEPIEPAIPFCYSSDSRLLRLTRCSVCNRIAVNNKWYDVASKEVRAKMEENKPLMISYSVCGDCTIAE